MVRPKNKVEKVEVKIVEKAEDKELFWTVIEKIKDFTDALTIHRLIVAIITSASLISTFTIYENRTSLAQTILNFGSDVPAATWQISEPSAASLAQLVQTSPLVKLAIVTEIDLQKNKRTQRYLFLSDPQEPEIRKKIPTLLPQAVFDFDAKNTAQIVGVLNHEFVCTRYVDTVFNRLYPELANSTPVLCRMAIPPFYGRFMGILAIGLSDHPTKDQIDALRIEVARLSVEIYLRDVVKKSRN